MRKIATFFLLLITFATVFTATASAQEVETTVINEDGTLVDVTTPGDEVAIDVIASAEDSTIEEPAVILNIDPETGLELEPEDAMMWDGIQYIQNDINDPFLYWDDEWGWVWYIGYVFFDMTPGDETELIVPAIVTDVGPITVNADFYAWPITANIPILLDSDSYTFLSVSPGPQPVNGATVPMQATGTPLAVVALGLLTVIGGTVYSKL
jgi:hypothetical protein